MARLTDVQARNLAPNGKPLQHGGVAGLRLEPGSTKGAGKWILRFVSPRSGKRRDMGLGGYPEVSLAEASQLALSARQQIREGHDPIDQRQQERATKATEAAELTFEQAARRVHEDSKPAWRNSKHVDQWINTLIKYVFPRLGTKKVSQIGPADFADVLKPIWLSKPETASRVKQRCHSVMRWCWAHALVKGNAVDVVDHLLPRQPGKRERVQHQPAMDWRALPDFHATSLAVEPVNVTRALLQFVILTATRSGEARAMRWEEVDANTRIWTVPANRMKAKVEHRVPLSDAAMAVLEARRRADLRAELVFPAPRGGVLSDMALTKYLRDKGAPSDVKGRMATAHGFRSTFRNWASEHGYARDLAERALAHTVSNRVEAAYHRTDLIEQRRPMMEAWASHVCGADASTNVVKLRA